MSQGAWPAYISSQVCLLGILVMEMPPCWSLYAALACFEHRRQRRRLREPMIGPDLDQRVGRQPAVSDQFFRIGEGHHIIAAAVENHRAWLHSSGRAMLLPRRAEKDK